MKTTAALILLGALPNVMNALSIEDVSNYLRGETNDFENGQWERTLQGSGYVQIIFPSGISSAFSSAFTNAASFWNNVLGTSPVTPLTFTSAFNVRTNLPGCGVTFTFPAGTVINGLAIFAVVSPIDGVGSILGQAGPCGFTGNFPRIGSMTFDSADVQQLLNAGQLGEVIRHEMGHVIGIGGRWSAFGLVQNPCTRTPCNTNPTYSGVNGKAGFAQLGGGSGNVPVSNEGGAGTFNAHWRESTFGNELMTGFLNAGVTNPMSIMTVRSLIDLGYNVNLASAQTYSIPRPEDISTGELEMVGDILETTPVDIEAVLEGIEKTNAESQKSGELTVFIGVVAALMALLVAFVVLVAYKIKRSNQTAIQEMKNMNLQAQVESFTPPPTRASKKDVAVAVAEE